jgi:hypothetical protein
MLKKENRGHKSTWVQKSKIFSSIYWVVFFHLMCTTFVLNSYGIKTLYLFCLSSYNTEKKYFQER